MNNFSEEEKLVLEEIAEMYFMKKEMSIDEAVDKISPIIDRLKMEDWQNKIEQFADFSVFGDEDKVYFVPTNKDKPVKVIFKEFPCPIIPQTHCKFAKMTNSGMDINISCTKKGICYYLK